MFDDMLDWAGDKVKNFSGENERRELVEDYKQLHIRSKLEIDSLISKVNEVIDTFNRIIDDLNDYRHSTVKKNIFNLGVFLQQFGNIKKIGGFALEDKQNSLSFPKKSFEKSENYIEQIDWSKDEVFEKTFKKTIFGVRSETKKLNLKIQQEMGNLKLETSRHKEQINSIENYINQDKQILNLYGSTVKGISETIQEKVIPEVELIQAFLQCNDLKDCLISNKEIQFKENNDISVIANTKYNKHYLFIKNTFMFFIISTKIYNTKIFSNLISNKEHIEEKEEVMNYNKILKENQSNMNRFITM
ncbi:hypothetical protein [Clostridium sp. 'White wine YQ']|uniref:hypothetical protein n=1 Tax=Clostridium sp. 'White wine YQ' TaxID=3027474 RepID=UPI002365611A|nr:hypothetical protein [Clostridium sp. 'White wine YQ']MDD7794366.1 hypothetical protein [Clostridium sp. 'White wine YQ']